MNAAAPPAPTARLFVALWPDGPTRDAIAAWQARWSWPAGAAIAPPERWHLTLHFIGPVPRARLAEIAPALAARCSRFEIAFGRAELWPRGLALLVPHALPPELVALHAALAERLARVGIAADTRAFRPHLTLARGAAGALPPAEAPALRWPVQGYALVESERGYRVLERYGA